MSTVPIVPEDVQGDDKWMSMVIFYRTQTKKRKSNYVKSIVLLKIVCLRKCHGKRISP